MVTMRLLDRLIGSLIERGPEWVKLRLKIPNFATVSFDSRTPFTISARTCDEQP